MSKLKKTFELEGKGGKLNIYTSDRLFMVKPEGIINPSLVKQDLDLANRYGMANDNYWIYLVDTERVKFPNPLNLLQLNKINKLPNMSQYIIFAPSLPVRILAGLTDFIIKPHQVIKSHKELEEFINNLHSLEGMGVNERLFVMGLTEVYDEAKTRKDAEAMKDILKSVFIDKESIANIIDSEL